MAFFTSTDMRPGPVRRNDVRHLMKRGTGAALAALLLVGTASAAPSPGRVAARTYRSGVILVSFDAGTTATERRKIVDAVGGASLRPLVRPATITGRRPGRATGGLFAVRIPSSDAAAVARTLELVDGVAYAEPDYLMSASATPNDPSFGLQWGSSNTGQTVNGTAGKPGADDSAAKAWNITTGSRSVVIAEVDSGVDYRHPDLAAKVWTNPGGVGGCAAGTRGFNVLTGSCDPMDDEKTYGGHGTHVAGILGAVGNNSTGVAGMNWTTTILPVKWLDSSGNGSTSQLIAALEWVLKAKRAGVNVRIVNDSATFVGTAYSQALSDEIDVLGANDILFVTAAGNTGESNDDANVGRYPCRYGRANELCVTASDQSDRLPSWANYGAKTVDLAAPGANIYSTLRNGTYGYVSGGSMAAPQVAGAAALVLARGYQSATSLKSTILNSVDKLSSLSGLVRTGGRLNVCKAVGGCATTAASTFGKSTVGASSDSLSANRKRVNRYSLSTSASLTKLTAYLAPSGVSGQQAIRGVVYADSGGSPGRLVAASAQLDFHSTDRAGWYDLTLPQPVALGAGNYWIGLLTGGTANVAAFRWDAGGTRVFNANTYSSGPSDPFGAVSGSDNEQASIYATYTPTSSPPPAPSPSPSPSPTLTTATFGKTSVGSSSDTFAADRKRVNRYALTRSGAVQKLRVYLAPTSTAGQQTIKGLVYADSNGAPGRLLASSNELVFRNTNAAGWYDLVLSSPLSLAAGNYWIGVITGPSSGVASFRWDAVASSRVVNANTYSAGPTDPFGAPSSTDSEQVSLYAEYKPT
jgi:subtilisin family serine protease